MEKINLPVVVYKTKYGNEVVRKYVVPTDPKTPKQLAYRMKFTLINSSLSPFCKIIKDGYKHKHNAYRSVISKALREAIEGEYPNFSINYSKIQLADGKLKLPSNIDASIQNNSLIFTWNPKTKGHSACNRSDDRVNIVCFDQSINKVFAMYNVASRGDGELNIDIKYENLHFWLYLSSIDGKENSGSGYVEID